MLRHFPGGPELIIKYQIITSNKFSSVVLPEVRLLLYCDNYFYQLSDPVAVVQRQLVYNGYFQPFPLVITLRKMSIHN